MRWVVLAVAFAGCAHAPEQNPPAAAPPPTGAGAGAPEPAHRATRETPAPGGPFDFTVRDSFDGGGDPPSQTRPTPHKQWVNPGDEGPHQPFSQ